MTGEYMHILDSEGRCSCGTFDGDVNDPLFTQKAVQHFRDTAEPVHIDGFFANPSPAMVVWTLVLVAAAAMLLWAAMAL